MPRGVYVRTQQMKESILEKRGNWKPANYGHFDNALIAEINSVISASDTKLTGMQIYHALVTKGIVLNGPKVYNHLRKQIYRARNKGRLDSECIRNGNADTMYHPKFHMGDKVRIIRQNIETPAWLRNELRLDNCRTITDVKKINGRWRYSLGSNGMGESPLELYIFRSYELEPYTKKTTAGRPRTKRKYTRQCKDTTSTNDSFLMNPSESPSISCVNQNNNELAGVC